MQNPFINSWYPDHQRHCSGFHAGTMPLILLTILVIFLSNMEAISQNWEKQRNQMVAVQIQSRGIHSKAVLDAMNIVPRQLFVPPNVRSLAYEDRPLPIGMNQTISQPYIVAYMTEQIHPKPGMKVLEIGTGSGYQAAVLAQTGCRVYTIELLEPLATNADNTLKKLGYKNVTVRCGDGYLGWPEEAPFDAIIVTAAPEYIPPKLTEQLKEGGIMVLPVGPVNSVQYLKLVTKKGSTTTQTNLLPVRFVPMVEKDDCR